MQLRTGQQMSHSEIFSGIVKDVIGLLYLFRGELIQLAVSVI
jgi:hypothetical protein